LGRRFRRAAVVVDDVFASLICEESPALGHLLHDVLAYSRKRWSTDCSADGLSASASLGV